MLPFNGRVGKFYISKPMIPKKSGGRSVDEPICHIEISKEGNKILVRVQTDLGGVREFRDESLETVLRQVSVDLQEEFDASATDLFEAEGRTETTES